MGRVGQVRIIDKSKTNNLQDLVSEGRPVLETVACGAHHINHWGAGGSPPGRAAPVALDYSLQRLAWRSFIKFLRVSKRRTDMMLELLQCLEGGSDWVLLHSDSLKRNRKNRMYDSVVARLCIIVANSSRSPHLPKKIIHQLHVEATYMVVKKNCEAVEEKFAKEEQKSYHINFPRFLLYFIFGLLLNPLQREWDKGKGRICVDCKNGADGPYNMGLANTHMFSVNSP
jgi:hypothetical protein